MSRLLDYWREVLRAVSPRLYEYVSHRRNGRLFERIHRRVIASTGCTVAGGPFAGMKYLSASFGSVLAPKLIGSYEEEIQPWIEASIERGYYRIVDIGCAEGYYAVGMAMRLPEASVIAFDASEEACGLCAELVLINGLEGRVDVRGRTDAAGVNASVDGGTLIICDCEGAEMELLDPDKAPRLKACDMIVETHDFLGVSSVKTISDRFKGTHKIERIVMRDRSVGDYQLAAGLPRKLRVPALNELRPKGQEWLRMTVANKGAG